jgi:flagellar assembly factor FliW
MNMTQVRSRELTLSASQQYSSFNEQMDRITESEIIFPKGMSAFEDYKAFTYRKEPRLKPFIYMHSIVDSTISFVCVDPFILTPSHMIEIDAETIANLEIEKPEDLIALCLVSVGRDMYTTTANLMSPIIINSRTLKGAQVIMDHVGPELLRYNVWSSIGQNTNQNFNKKAN